MDNDRTLGDHHGRAMEVGCSADLRPVVSMTQWYSAYECAECEAAAKFIHNVDLSFQRGSQGSVSTAFLWLTHSARQMATGWNFTLDDSSSFISYYPAGIS